MVKTRSQALSATAKREEHEDESQLEQLLHSTNKATKNKSKVEKNKRLIQAQNAGLRPDNLDNSKAALTSLGLTLKKSKFKKVKLKRLISYIVNDQMTLTAASKKAGIPYGTACFYYKNYRSNPDNKIPLTKAPKNPSVLKTTQREIDNLIRYIVQEGMSVSQASTKVNIPSNTGAKYYARYLEDPERKIPLLDVGVAPKRYTQEEVAELINYIVRDKMTITEASDKANMSQSTAKKYYLMYLQDPDNEIPDPHESTQRAGKNCTNDQVKSLIGYIVNDGMPVLEASIKANMGRDTGRRYYNQYLNDPENNIPTPENKNMREPCRKTTPDQVKNFFRYIIVDRLTATEAARKSHISVTSGRAYYNKYLKSPNDQIKIKDMTYSAEKMKRFVELVQNEKMSLRKAADAVDLNSKSASKHYHQYLQNPQYEFPENKSKQYTQEDIKMLIDYIERDKKSVNFVAKRINMNKGTALKYYRMYQNDPKHKIPVPHMNRDINKIKTVDKYRQIIADIYRDNPSITPIHGNHHPGLNETDVKIEEELVEEDNKILLRTDNN